MIVKLRGFLSGVLSSQMFWVMCSDTPLYSPASLARQKVPLSDVGSLSSQPLTLIQHYFLWICHVRLLVECAANRKMNGGTTSTWLVKPATTMVRIQCLDFININTSSGDRISRWVLLSLLSDPCRKCSTLRKNKAFF